MIPVDDRHWSKSFECFAGGFLLRTISEFSSYKRLPHSKTDNQSLEPYVMEVLARFERLYRIEIRRLLSVILVAVGLLAVLQCSGLSYRKILSPPPADKASNSTATVTIDSTILGDSKENRSYEVKILETYNNGSNVKNDDDFDEESTGEMMDYGSSSKISGKIDYKNSSDSRELNFSATGPKESSMAMQKVVKSSDTNSSTSLVVPGGSIALWKHKKVPIISIQQMNSILVQSLASSHSPRPRRSSARDLEISSMKSEIENASIVRDVSGLYASVFRNISKFKRSYELMERKLKVYIYKEGEKPIFHKSKMRGIYASEGWFMKLMEESKKFVVRDPRKAHVFYMPIGIKMLREALGRDFRTVKDLENYMKKYVDLIAGKYRFWNRTGGADHFLVSCHDWANKLTRNPMKNSIRSLCNSNAAQGFEIGKDTSLPVTNIRSSESPLEYLGGKPPSERETLAFFAGSMHGYLRRVLLRYWENKEPDMKIFGPMPRDSEGQRMYREYMKSSRYCICPRGYEVHTPRIVEAIFHDCVPVIISDNYVPPFFEVFNWETFSVFIEEKDVPNLRNILREIPEEKYLAMQAKVRMVQRHFLWHKNPVKYDLFHMILHSVWYNRVFGIKP